MTSPAPSSDTRPSWFLPGAVGVVIGLVVGVFAGSFFADGGSGDGAEADAATTCDYVGALVEDLDPETIGLQDPTLLRLQAAAALAQAARVADPAYTELGEQGRELVNGVSTVDIELVQTTLQEMDETCQDL